MASPPAINELPAPPLNSSEASVSKLSLGKLSIGETYICTLCDGDADALCPTCKSAPYCSVTCQIGDYWVHRHVCEQYKARGRPPGPAEDNFRRAFLFHPDEVRVEVVWVECIPQEVGSPDRWTLAYYRSFLEPEHPLVGHSAACVYIHWSARHDPQEHSFALYYNDAPPFERTRPNKTIQELTDGKPDTDPRFRGPVLVMKYEGTTDEPMDYEDMEMEDLRDIVDYLVSEHAPDLDMEKIRSRPKTKGLISDVRLSGVRVACNGEMRLRDVPRLSAEMFDPKKWPLSPDYSSLGLASGFAIIAMMVPFDTTSPAPYSEDMFDNPIIPHLFPVLNHDSPFWGLTQRKWRQGAGSVILARRDGEPLTVKQVAMWSSFAKLKAHVLLKDGLGVGSVERSREQVGRLLNSVCYARWCLTDSKAEAVEREELGEAAGSGWQETMIQP